MKKICVRTKKRPLFFAISVLVSAVVLTACGNSNISSKGNEKAVTTQSQPVSSSTTSTVSSAGTTATTASVTSEAETTTTTTVSSKADMTTLSLVTTKLTTTTTTTAPPPPPTTTQAPTEPPVPTEPPTTAATQPPTEPPTTTAVQTAPSDNKSFYQQNIYIAGDSIATGFSLFRCIPAEHSLSVGSLSMSNLDWYYPQQRGIGFIDAVANARPKLLYISMGMNDVNMTSPENYAAKYVSVISQILQRVPNATIVAAGITPVYNGISFTNNPRIQSFNAALANAVSGIDRNRVFYFDAYSVLVDPSTNGLRSGYSSGDGIHLSTGCYSMLLDALYSMLDTTPAIQNMIS